MSTPRLHVEVLLKDIESDVYISRDTARPLQDGSEHHIAHRNQIEDEVEDHLKNTYRLPVCDGQLLDMSSWSILSFHWSTLIILQPASNM